MWRLWDGTPEAKMIAAEKKNNSRTLQVLMHTWHVRYCQTLTKIKIITLSSFGLLTKNEGEIFFLN